VSTLRDQSQLDQRPPFRAARAWPSAGLSKAERGAQFETVALVNVIPVGSKQMFYLASRWQIAWSLDIEQHAYGSH
jgi:hypothetical protein